jgi:hypothetical protein
MTYDLLLHLCSSFSLRRYHSLIEKEVGATLYEQFIKTLREKIEQNKDLGNSIPRNEKQNKEDSLNSPHQQQAKRHGMVQHGTYGNRQGLKFISNGPYTHQFEF